MEGTAGSPLGCATRLSRRRTETPITTDSITHELCMGPGCLSTSARCEDWALEGISTKPRGQ
jgi:hypothetical protein